MFRHPKYYKELKEFGKRGDRGKPTAASPDTDQAISQEAATAAIGVRPDPGPKLQATSLKRQALRRRGHKPQAPSSKHQAPSRKLQAPRSENHGKVSRCLNRGALA